MSVYVKFTKFEGREGTTEIEKVPVRGEGGPNFGYFVMT